MYSNNYSIIVSLCSIKLCLFVDFNNCTCIPLPFCGANSLRFQERRSRNRAKGMEARYMTRTQASQGQRVTIRAERLPMLGQQQGVRVQKGEQVANKCTDEGQSEQADTTELSPHANPRPPDLAADNVIKVCIQWQRSDRSVSRSLYTTHYCMRAATWITRHSRRKTKTEDEAERSRDKGKESIKYTYRRITKKHCIPLLPHVPSGLQAHDNKIRYAEKFKF